MVVAERETAQCGLSAWYVCGRERDCTVWCECLVWLWQRDTVQCGVGAWYGCERETA